MRWSLEPNGGNCKPPVSGFEGEGPLPAEEKPSPDIDGARLPDEADEPARLRPIESMVLSAEAREDVPRLNPAVIPWMDGEGTCDWVAGDEARPVDEGI